METRCPSCSRPIELAKFDTDDLQTISSVQCPNCGLVPFRGAAETVTYVPSKEPLQTIAHFALVRLLGQGSFGSVWLAEDTKLGRRVALKTASADRQETAGLLYEAQAAAKLKHSNIVAVYEVGSEDGQVYIASEYIDGLNLRDLLSAGKPTTERAVDVTLAVARALAHAHEQGVVHRDIKPANIMVNSENQPFVADFGLAKRISNDASISAEGQILGTALYMSPEQAGGKTREIDGRTDLYALGVMLFEMLTGHVPFRGNVQAVLHQKVNEDVPSPRTLNPNVPKDLETMCLKCVERDPDKRYRSAGELADELERFKTGVPIKARPVTAPEKAWRWCLRHRAVAGLLAGLFLSLSGGLAGVSYFGLQSAANARLANQRLYRAEMNLAAEYLSNGDVEGVRRTLERFESDDELSGLRGFEWHYHKTAVAPFLQVSNQGDPVQDVAVFSDGRFYAACGGNRQARVWDVKDGKLIQTLSLESRRFLSIAASPVSGNLATGSSDGMIRIWTPLKHDRPIQQMKHGPPVALLRYSPDGKRLLSAGAGGAARIWDLVNESVIAQLPGGMSGTKGVRFGPDGKSAVVASADGRVRIWEIETESIVQILQPNPNVESLAVSDDGQTIVTGSFDGQLRVWSVAEGELQYSHEIPRGLIGDLEFLKGTPLLAVPTISGDLVIFDTHARREIQELATHSLTSGIVARSADGKILAVGSGGGSVKLLRVADLKRPDVLWHDDHVRCVGFLPDGRRLMAASGDGTVRIWSIKDGGARQLTAESSKPLTMAVQPQGRLVAIAGAGSRVALWNWETGKRERELDVAKSPVTAVAFSSSGRRFAACSGTGALAVFDSSDWSAPQFETTPHESAANALLFSPNDREVVVAYDNGQVSFVDADAGRQQRREIAVPTIPLSMCYCAAGSLLAIGTETGELRLYEVETGQSRWIIRAHASRVNVVAPFPDGRTFVSGGRDKVLNLWHAASGELLTTLLGHQRQIFCIAVSPDGRTVASGGLEGDVRVWRSN